MSMNTAKKNKATCPCIRRRISRTPKAKPEVRVVEMRDGSLRIINGGLAAKFCGVKPQTFSAFLRRHYKVRQRPSVDTTEQRIRAAYPELFK